MTAYRNGLPVAEWASSALLDLYIEANRIAETLESGTTERGLIREAMAKIELADRYVDRREEQEEREREEMRLDLRAEEGGEA